MLFYPAASIVGCSLDLMAALILALQREAAPRQCREIPLNWHPAQAPDRETPVFDQAIAGHALVPSASVTAPCDPAPANGDEAMIALWLDGRPPATRRAYEADAAALLACLGGVPLRQATLADMAGLRRQSGRACPGQTGAPARRGQKPVHLRPPGRPAAHRCGQAAAPAESQERAGRTHPGGDRGDAADGA